MRRISQSFSASLYDLVLGAGGPGCGSKAHRPSVDIVSPAHDRFVGAEDEVLAALAEDLPELVTACQFSGQRGDFLMAQPAVRDLKILRDWAEKASAVVVASLAVPPCCDGFSILRVFQKLEIPAYHARLGTRARSRLVGSDRNN